MNFIFISVAQPIKIENYKPIKIENYKPIKIEIILSI